MLGELAVSITHSQIFLNVPSAPSAGLLWTDEDTAQGFAWAPGVVCFGVPDHDGESLIEVHMLSRDEIDPDALWAVRVPFLVDAGKIVVGSVFEETEFDIENGRYSIICEVHDARQLKKADFFYVIRLNFFKTATAIFEIIRQGKYIKTDKVLNKIAKYA